MKVEQEKEESMWKFVERFNKELLETEKCVSKSVITTMTNGVWEDKLATLFYTKTSHDSLRAHDQRETYSRGAHARKKKKKKEGKEKLS